MNLLSFFLLGESSNFRATAFNIYIFSGTIDAKYNAIRDHINRVGGDIVFLTEVSDTGYTAVVNNLALDTGYSYTVRGTTGTFGNCFMSKTPMSNVQLLTNAYINAPGGGAEMPESTGITRCQITVNGQIMIIYGVHLTPWCFAAFNPGCIPSVLLPKLEFERAIQLYRIYQDYQAQAIASPTAKFIIMGDYNEDDASLQTDSFASQPAGMRESFVLGSDIGFPYNYSTFPDDHITDFTILKGTDLNNDRDTIWADDPNPALTVAVRLDYIALGPDIIHVGNEVLNSEVDANTGLPKIGSPLPNGLSQTASDHKLVFADLFI